MEILREDPHEMREDMGIAGGITEEGWLPEVFRYLKGILPVFSILALSHAYYRRELVWMSL